MVRKYLQFTVLMLCFGMFSSAVQAQTREETAAPAASKPVMQMKRLDGVTVERKRPLVDLELAQKTDIESDLQKLIDADPVLSLSVEEFYFVVEIQQWAIAQQKRMKFVDVLKARHAALTTNRASLKQKKDVATELAAIDEALNTLGEDAQLANVDLQNGMQKMQQALQLMSNVSKTSHDTAMGVIRKIG